MNVQIVGTMLDPSGGEPAGGAMIQFIALAQYGGVPKGAQSTQTTSATGEYDFPLNYGRYTLAINHSGRFVNQAVSVTVNEDSPPVMDIDLLLESSVPLTPPEIKYVEELVEQAEQAALSSSNSASQAGVEVVSATNQANIATNEADRARSEADRATEVSGLDTVEDAVDLALGESSPSIIAEALEQMGGGKLLYVPDNLGQSHLVYRFSPFTYEDLDIPDCPFTGVMDAFLRQDGSIRPYIDVAVHEMCSINGKAASKAAMAPWVSINTDTTRARCEELREDAMMVGRYISAMLGWLMISKGFQPRGNTEHGRSHSNKNEFGRRTDGRVPNDRNGSGVILTGTGPDEWRHDGAALGVSNWVGNIWERDEGWKLVDGQIYVSEYMAQPEAEWAATGRFINTGHRFSMADESEGSSDQVWSQFVKDADYIGHELLQRLLIEPIDCTRVLQGRFYYNLGGERFPLRGASWGGGADAGPAAIGCYDERSGARSSIGGRFAFAS